MRLISSGIVTNAANIVLDSPNANFYRDTGTTSALANFAVNAAAGSFTIGHRRNFTAAAPFTNQGTLTVGDQSTFSTPSLTNFADTTLTGGIYVLSGTLQFGSADVRTNAASIVLAGPLGEIVNQSFSDGLADLAVNAATGTFTLSGGRNFQAAPAFTNDGTLIVSAGSAFQTPSLTNFADTTLTGRTYRISGTLQFNDADIHTNAATLVLDGAAARIIDQAEADALAHFAANAARGNLLIQNGRNFTVAGAFSNAGQVTVGAGSTFTTLFAYNQMPGGSTTLNGGILAASTVVIQEDSVLSGSGTIQASVVNAGEIDVGGPGSAGLLTITGDFTQLDGVLNLKLGGLAPGSQYDQLAVGGTAILGGTLNIALLEGFVSLEGDSFQVLQFAVRSGDFAHVNGLDLSETLFLRPFYDATSLTLIATARS